MKYKDYVCNNEKCPAYFRCERSTAGGRFASIHKVMFWYPGENGICELFEPRIGKEIEK